MASMNSQLITKARFAPSPTGLIHLGNARTALLSALFACHQKGIFLLRIEDTDVSRSTAAFAESLMEDLRWLGLEWQEGAGMPSGEEGKDGPYWQSQRSQIYQTYYQELLAQGRAYPCFCSELELNLIRKQQLAAGKPPRYPGTCRRLSPEDIARKQAEGLKPAIRFRLPETGVIEFEDLVKGQQHFPVEHIGDFIIRRMDEGSAFLFCNAIDDALMGVTHVIRGEDHLTNTPRQLAILQALNLPIPRYGHISLILGKDGTPLSKRNGSRSLKELRELGYLPLAVMNYLARLGHYYESHQLMSFEELGSAFSVENLSHSAARYDEQQLLHWQKEAVQALSTREFWHWMPAPVQARVPSERRDAFIDLIRHNLVFSHEAVNWAEVFLTEQLSYTEAAQAVLRSTPPGFFLIALEALQKGQSQFADLAAYIKSVHPLQGKALFQPLRVALTGALQGPDMGKVVDFLGPEQMTRRFEAVIDLLTGAGYAKTL